MSEFTDAQLESMMDAMESIEGFGAKSETRKEKWVHTTRLTVSDDARPLVGEEVKVKVGQKEYTTKTKAQGAIPPIVHVSADSPVEIFLKTLEGHWKSVYSFVAGNQSRQLLATRDQQKFQGIARLKASGSKPESGKDQRPLVYVVQSGDSLSKIAGKFKTTVGELRQHNHGIVKTDLIFPGQKLNIYGAAGAPSANLASPPAKPTPKPKAAEPTTPVVSKQGQPLALVDPAQRQAPWMEVAIRETTEWAGASEAVITKKDNYHKAISMQGDLDEVPWCASFVNFVLKEAGYPYERSAGSQFPTWSKKFVKIGAPVYGALMVWRKGGQGHIAFVYGRDKVSGEVIALGGNQDDRITFMLKTDTAKVFQNYYVPAVYQAEAKRHGELSEFDIVELNSNVAGYASYRRKTATRDR